MGFPNKTRASGAAESVPLTGYLLLPIKVDLQPLMLIRGKSSPRRPRFSQPGLLRFPAVLLPHVVSPLQHRWCGYLGVGNHPRFHPQSPVTAWSREENPFGIFIAVLLEICGWTARQLLPGALASVSHQKPANLHLTLAVYRESVLNSPCSPAVTKICKCSSLLYKMWEYGHIVCYLSTLSHLWATYNAKKNINWMYIIVTLYCLGENMG